MRTTTGVSASHRTAHAVRTTPGEGKPFDHGVFERVEEAVGAAWPEDDTQHHFTYARVAWPAGWEPYPAPETHV